MANRYATKTGNWSDVTVWDGGTTLPTTGDVVRPNSYTVTIDQNITVGELRNDAASPAVAGGAFVANSGVTINANVSAYATGVSFFLDCNAGNQVINGNLTNYSTFNSAVCVRKNSTGNLSITGNVLVEGFSGSSTHGLLLGSTAACQVTGNVTGKDGISLASFGISAGNTGGLTIIGNVIGRGIECFGLNAFAVQSINVTGTVNGLAGRAINITSAVALSITGNCVATTNEAVWVQTGSPVLTINGNLIPSISSPAINSASQTATFILNGNIQSASNGTAPNARGILLIHPSNSLSHEYRANSGGVAGVARTLFTVGAAVGNPATGDVRLSTVYGPNNEYTGTLAVPSPSLVAIGVPTDNTVGTYTAAPTASDIRSAIGLATANLDTQLAALPTASEVADAVWDEDNRDHLTAHSTGKNLDTIRKANYVTDGLVAAGGTPTTTVFRTTLTQPDDTYDHQTLLFLTGNLEGESKPILSYSQTNGEITLDEALTEAPVAGNEFVILPHHVHPLSIMVSRIFANEVESGGYTLTRTLQAIGSMLAGLVSGAGSGTESFKAIGNSAKTRVQFIVDDDGNRTGVTYDWS
jgi:hypothetical protein